jgi:putative transposase
VKRAYRFRFYPTPRQERRLAREFGAARWVWNHALAETSRAWKEHQKRLSIVEMSRRVTVLKRSRSHAWLAEVSSTVLTQSLRDLERARVNFFAKHAAYPRFKKRSFAQAVRYQLDPRQKTTWRAGERLVLPRLGRLRLVWSRLPLSRPLMVTLRRDAIGRYFVSFAVEEQIAPLPVATSAIGIDVGLRSTVALSDGTTVAAPKHLLRRLRTLQHRGRVVSRRKRGSRRREDARHRLARAHARVADERREWLHRLTTTLVRENQTICVEDLNVAGMVRNRRLSRALADGSLAELHRQLEYKAEWYGRSFIRIGRFYPSSKTCSECGWVLEVLPLAVREWTCPQCGMRHDRDLNAARNILAEGLRRLQLPPGGREVMRVEGDSPRPFAGRPAKRESHGIEVRS